MIKLNELLQFTVCFTLCRNITVLQFTYVFSLRCFAVSNFILLLSFPACLPVTIWKMKWKLLLHFSWIHHRFNHFFHFTRFNHRSQTGLRLREHWGYGQLHVITLFNKLKIFLKKVNLSLMKWWIYLYIKLELQSHEPKIMVCIVSINILLLLEMFFSTCKVLSSLFVKRYATKWKWLIRMCSRAVCLKDIRLDSIWQLFSGCVMV